MLRLALILALCALLTPLSAEGATRYVSAQGAGTVCSQLQPCASFAAAYRAAQAGDVVEVAAGRYSAQTLSSLPAKTGYVTFRPALGATVRTGRLEVSNSSYVEVRDMQADGWSVTNAAKHVIYRNIKVDGLQDAGGYFSGSDDVQILGGEIAHIDPNDGIHMNANGGQNTNVIIDGLYMHDLTISRDPSSHDDCIQTGSAVNLVIRDSRFENCGTQGVFLNPYGTGRADTILVENNYFGIAQLGYNILYVGDSRNVTVRNNRIAGWVYSYNPASFTSLKFTGNLLAGNDSYNCGVLAQRSAVFTANTTRVKCGDSTNTTDPDVLAKIDGTTPPTTTPTTTATTPTTTSTTTTPAPTCTECDQLRAQLAQAQTDLATANGTLADTRQQLIAAQAALADMTASRDAVQRIADAYKARAEKAEDQVARIKAITGE
jgi:hypothetical protein